MVNNPAIANKIANGEVGSSDSDIYIRDSFNIKNTPMEIGIINIQDCHAGSIPQVSEGKRNCKRMNSVIDDMTSQEF